MRRTQTTVECANGATVIFTHVKGSTTKVRVIPANGEATALEGTPTDPVMQWDYALCIFRAVYGREPHTVDYDGIAMIEDANLFSFMTIIGEMGYQP